MANEKVRAENEAIQQNSLLIQEEFIQKSQRVSELEGEVAGRPTNDDINILKTEILQVQKLMDTIVKEKENEYKQLQGDYKELELLLEK